ncbi:Cell division control protein 25 [Fulvia fulva]|uniref:Class E vacuolar protein-sorting machinery protein HSE1 n=1 Tax=Passalora fulva TaxID=5499 RepID=A0A9Q8LBN4_PASFU|nr:Cell division control protein 25 [Fulvia fulva]KAK4633434.1 Cell division control protein 25 [Fulvia fulva]UJO14510.1 Cell division control protein 25 [Fulvia fulva]WPV12025.1 Cell division control protein 25 [Fulvia fulva]
MVSDCRPASPHYDQGRQPARASRERGDTHEGDISSQQSSQTRRDNYPFAPRRMSGLAGSHTGGQLYVRALYDYDADDRTSLSFRSGDIIQVITQLESGWWDGVIHGVRGWFPSNYCAVVAPPYEDGMDNTIRGDSEAEESEEEYVEQEAEHPANRVSDNNETATVNQEEAAFWIPQATPDGRLFYFNTLTGESTMELPLEAPTSANETGPRDRTNIFIPDQTRPPADFMSSGYERDDDTDYASASEAEDASLTQGSKASSHRRRRSYLSDGVSPATSMDSLSQVDPLSRSRTNLTEASNMSLSAMQQGIPPVGTTMTSFANAPTGGSSTSLLPRRFFDDAHAVPLTWNTMVEDMRRAVQRYREVVSAGERSEFVRKAEDISDHLRLLLAAGSGTTDNHSGNPSIISTNKALYPHFREMMSRFSKLVLSSHIAAADFPAPDSTQKCLHEAEGVLHGVYGFVEVARQQRGEEIPRLTPGFVMGSKTAGNWQSNGLDPRDRNGSMSFMDDEHDTSTEPTATLDAELLSRLDDLKRLIVSSIRRLDEHLVLRDKLITHHKHRQIGDAICRSGTQVIEVCRPYMSTIESVNLQPLHSPLQTPQLNDFAEHKQRFYDSTADLIVACQIVASPLGDEWAEIRGPSLEERLTRLKSVGRDLDTATNQIYFSLQLLSELIPHDSNKEHRLTDGGAPFEQQVKNKNHLRPTLADIGTSKSYSEGTNAPPPSARSAESSNSSKVERFFGQVPAANAPGRDSEEMPDYLRLDHEGEIAYDIKVDPPQLRGGTLVGLVEQLTRHDRLDSPFNNTFLLTYRSFTSAEELFELLVKRWTIQPLYGLTGQDMQTWIDKKQKPIRFRVVNILKSWMDNYWMEANDEVSQKLLQRVHTFAKDTVQSTSTPGAVPLIAAIEQRLRGQDSSNKRLVLTLNSQAPAPIIPKNMKKLKFLDIDALEFARQLTIIESKLYGKIKPTECLNKTWQKKLAPGEADPAENVKALILHSNQLTNWVAQMILTQADVKRRVVVIKHFVSIADKCRTLNNFSCLTSIISALGSAPIHRLNRTWSQVNARTTATLESMRKLMGSTKNFLEYRESLHKANPPCIPFFGIYLTDLTFIEDGIPGIIKKTQLINFAKRAKTAEVIRDIQQYQNVPYGLQSVPELQDYILRNMQSAGDVHEMYERSLQVEPREREDEKIARLLSESGFL